MAEAPERGDVAVFKVPRDNETDYIKRVIGLPGDRIQMQQGVLYINGQAIPKVRVDDYVDPAGEGAGIPIPQYRETLPNGVAYNVLDKQQGSTEDDTQEYVVPPDHYFMMGDNRDNSMDSRFANVVGYVPYENFVGRADIIFFSIEPEAAFWEIWKWPLSIRWSRFLNIVH